LNLSDFAKGAMKIYLNFMWEKGNDGPVSHFPLPGILDALRRAQDTRESTFWTFRKLFNFIGKFWLFHRWIHLTLPTKKIYIFLRKVTDFSCDIDGQGNFMIG
jgi:hypothetical protein